MEPKLKFVNIERNNYNNYYNKKNFDYEENLININNSSRISTLKDSELYWNNTKKKNLNTSSYINNPNKIQGKGFGNINIYKDNIGISTRQTKPSEKPNNIENDRLYFTNHNYNNTKYHVLDRLGCGIDTRILNKNIL